MKATLLLALLLLFTIPSLSQPVGTVMEYSGGAYVQRISQFNGTSAKFTATLRPAMSVSSIGFLWKGLISESFVLGEHLGIALPAGFGSDGFNIGFGFEFGGKFSYAFSDDVQAGFKHIFRDYRVATSERVQMKANYFHGRYGQHFMEIGFTAPKDGKVTNDADKYFSLEYRLFPNSIRKDDTNYFYGVRLENYLPNRGLNFGANDKTMQLLVLFGWTM